MMEKYKIIKLSKEETPDIRDWWSPDGLLATIYYLEEKYFGYE